MLFRDALLITHIRSFYKIHVTSARERRTITIRCVIFMSMGNV